MQAEIKNEDILPVLTQLVGLVKNNQQLPGFGLIQEKITIGAKARIQKIANLLLPHYNEFVRLHNELIKKYGGIEGENGVWSMRGGGSSEFNEEYMELATLVCTINFDPVDFSKIENAETSNSYDFASLSIFFENYN